jgi:hypothetical protein
MTSVELLGHLRAQLHRAKTRGQMAVPVDALEELLDKNSDHENAGTPQAVSQPKVDWEVLKVSAPLDHAWDLSLMESTFKASEATLKSATLKRWCCCRSACVRRERSRQEGRPSTSRSVN